MQVRVLSFLYCLLVFAGSGVHALSAETIGFRGVVLPSLQSDPEVFEQPQTLVSFSDQIALAFPVDFGTDGKIRIFNDFGDLVKGLKLLSLASESGVKTRVAVVDLLPGGKQTFLLCDLERCIRYKVIRQ